MDPQKYYDEFSKNYDSPRDRGYHAYLDEEEFSCIKDLAKGDVLEVGCGTGLIMQKIKTARSVTGIDISPGMLEHAKKRGLNVMLADATDLPFEDNSFDLIYSFKVLAHIPMIRKAISEMVRVTRPGGMIAAEFYNANSLRFLTKRLRAGMVADGVSERDVFIRFDTVDEFRGYFPPEMKVARICSARHCLMSPVAMGLPMIGSMVKLAEKTMAKTPISVFGGFVTLVMQKS